MIPKSSTPAATTPPAASASSSGPTAMPGVAELPSLPLPSQPSVVTFAPEIRSMMHAFGDCSQPQAETAGVVEDIVRDQVN